MLSMYEGSPLFYDREDMRWVSLMPRDKAAMILEAFDTPNEEMFLILGDWMEDRGENPKEIQRFRSGNWRQQDYDHASCTMFHKVIWQFRDCPSVKVFIRLLQANWKHEKFIEWYSKTFIGWQLLAFTVMKDAKQFEEAYGRKARERLKRSWPKPTEEIFRESCDAAKEMCYWLRKKEDLQAWSELWKDRRYYIQRPLSSWEKSYNATNTISW